MKHNRFGVANWFVRQALDDQTITVYGEGSAKRDFLYVGYSVEAIINSTACEAAYGELFNVGNNQANSFRELAELVVEMAECGR